MCLCGEYGVKNAVLRLNSTVLTACASKKVLRDETTGGLNVMLNDRVREKGNTGRKGLIGRKEEVKE